MKRTTVLALCLVFPLPAGTRLAAQARSPGVPASPSAWTQGLIHYGKWTTGAMALALTVQGAREHSRSAREWKRLLGLCRADNAACTLGADGRYVSATAEQYYQTSITFDRHAHGWLLGGQLSLLVTAALFVADLHHHTNGPDNIPFHHPLNVSVDPASNEARVGLRIAF